MPCLTAIQKTDQAGHPSSPPIASRHWSPKNCKFCAVQTLHQRHSKKKEQSTKAALTSVYPSPAELQELGMSSGLPFCAGTSLNPLGKQCFQIAAWWTKKYWGWVMRSLYMSHQPNQIPCTIMAKNHRSKASTKSQAIHRSSITQEEHLLFYLSRQPETQHF